MSDRTDLRELVHASATASLPGDYVELTTRRLGIAAAGTAILYFVYLVLYRTVWAATAQSLARFSSTTGFLVSIAAAAYLLSGRRPPARVAVVAVSYEIVLAFVLAVAENGKVSYATSSVQVPWTAVVIVLFPFLIPASARVVLAASVAAAATTPLAIALVCGLGGRPWPEPSVFASLVLPPFLCVLLAWAPTSALHRLGDAVQHARRLGNYELSERLGQGGMGEVWRANHRLLARPAAVKLIKPEILGAKDARSRDAVIRRFEKEAQATASLESTHSVELYDFGVSAEGALFYVMELLHGVDLQILVERFGPLPSEERAEGDRAPDRAESLDSAASAKSFQTDIGQIVGTPAFLAPEAALREQAIDARADLYALGCVAYWLLTGTAVFEATNAMSMALAHVATEPQPPSQRVSWPVLAELERVVMKCLQKDRELRPGSATDLRDLLATIALPEPWSRERAAQWWQAHLPADASAARER